MLVGLLLIACASGYAQTWEEWTQQEQTKIKRLVEQIAANQVYLDYVKKGIRIVTGGLHTIRDIKSGHFKLHFGFIDSLKIVNPTIKGWIKVAAIISEQGRLLQLRKQALNLMRESGEFTVKELRYCQQIYDNLLAECLQDIDELMLVVTNGELSMRDDERMQRIEVIYENMQDKTSFAISFASDLRVLAMQRKVQQTEINYSKLLNGF